MASSHPSSQHGGNMLRLNSQQGLLSQSPSASTPDQSNSTGSTSGSQVNLTNSLMLPTWHGFIHTNMDACIIVEACLRGELHHIPRRPHDRERGNIIRSGNVFVYEENASGIKRWTDGVTWSPSRIMGDFLLYRELSEAFPPGEKKRAKKRKRDNTGPEKMNANTIHTEQDRKLVGSLVDSYGFKPNGLIKKTITLKLNGVSHHIVAYYTLEHVKMGAYRRPYFDDMLKNITIRREFLNIEWKSILYDNEEDAEHPVMDTFHGRQSLAVMPPQDVDVHHDMHHGSQPMLSQPMVSQPMVSQPSMHMSQLSQAPMQTYSNGHLSMGQGVEMAAVDPITTMISPNPVFSQAPVTSMPANFHNVQFGLVDYNQPPAQYMSHEPTQHMEHENSNSSTPQQPIRHDSVQTIRDADQIMQAFFKNNPRKSPEISFDCSQFPIMANMQTPDRGLGLFSSPHMQHQDHGMQFMATPQHHMIQPPPAKRRRTMPVFSAMNPSMMDNVHVGGFPGSSPAPQFCMPHNGMASYV